MEFSIIKSMEILERTPQVLTNLLYNISDDWSKSNEGEQTWSAYDIIGHLIHGEKTDWIERIALIMSDQADKNFTPFDRYAQFESNKDKSLTELLNTFSILRTANLERLKAFDIQESALNRLGIHPAFGEVTLSQLLTAWVVHDLNHLAQISRVMASQYKEQVGPWIAYLKILNS